MLNSGKFLWWTLHQWESEFVYYTTTNNHFHPVKFEAWVNPSVFYLELDGSGTDEEQWVAVPDVDVHGVEGQVAQKPALLSWLQETLVYSELHLQAWRSWTRREETLAWRENTLFKNLCFSENSDRKMSCVTSLDEIDAAVLVVLSWFTEITPTLAYFFYCPSFVTYS